MPRGPHARISSRHPHLRLHDWSSNHPTPIRARRTSTAHEATSVREILGTKGAGGGNTGKADMGRANHLGQARGDPSTRASFPYSFRHDLDQPVSARRTRVRLAARGPTDEHRPRA